MKLFHPMKPSLLALLVMLSVSLAGCASSSGKETRRQTLVASLLDTDRAFSHLAQQRGLPEAFALFAANDAMQLPPVGPPVVGPVAIRNEMAASPPGTTLNWTVQHAEASRDGSLGWTWGNYEFRAPGDARPIVRTGKYLTVWRRQPKGSWKFVADIGNQAPGQ